MSRRKAPSQSPSANNALVITELAATLHSLLLKMADTHSLQVRLAIGYEIHAYVQLQHIIRVDFHRLDRRPFFALNEEEEGEE